MGLPVEINNLMMGAVGGYQVGRSLRFRSSASAYLSRTPSVTGNQKKWTWSAWVKRGKIGAAGYLMTAPNNSGPNDGTVGLYFESDDKLYTYYDTSGTNPYGPVGPAVYRDPSAWYHIVWAVDAVNTIHYVYVNNVLVSTDTSKYPPNFTYSMNQSGYLQTMGTQAWGISTFFDGYLAEVNFIDGQALTPSSFGSTDVNGIWQPKKYTGTYGTNGFYLPFSDTSSTTNLVKDSSGNANNWTPNNISLTAGTTYDSMLDVPINNSATASNFCVINPLSASGATISDGNLQSVVNGASFGTMGVSSGKWYWEVAWAGGGTATVRIAIFNTAGTFSTANARGDSVYSYAYTQAGNKRNNGTNTAYGASYSNGDILSVALDMDAGTVTFYKNGVSQGVAFSGLSGTFAPELSSGTANATLIANFGQRPFTYTPPTGFKSLNTYNLPVPSIKQGNQYFDISLWTGNGGTQSITNTAGFQPDLVWMKSRGATFNSNNHNLFDSVRGVNKAVFTDLTNAEITFSTRLTSFNSNGFTTGAEYNTSGISAVGWQWKGGGTAVSNTSGTITSSVSANTSAGFSIVSYTGNITSGATVGHGLGVAPNMIIIKSRTNGTDGWVIYHSSVGNTKALFFDTSTGTTQAAYWNNTSPSSIVFTLGFGTGANNTTPNIAYCFAAVSGYSAFGSYTGNGSSDGPFVYLGFRPRFIMFKNISNAAHWTILDSSRNAYNITGTNLFPDLTSAENSTGGDYDFLSNGFKLRNVVLNETNQSGATYIYAAFAENPFSIARAR